RNVTGVQTCALPISTVWIDTVKRGSVLRQVRGLGTLVPVEIQWIPAVTEGRVDKIRELPGTQVKPDTVILELSNPQLQQETLDEIGRASCRGRGEDG